MKFEYETEVLTCFVGVSGGRCNRCGDKDTSQRKRYKPDFICGPRRLLLEAKGRFVSKSRTKFLAIIQQNPERNIRIIFMADNPLEGKSGKRYSDWCRANGVTFTVNREGRIPEEWAKEFKT